jgi:hypothetical protein
MIIKTLEQDPDRHRSKMLDPDPHGKPIMQIHNTAKTIVAMVYGSYLSFSNALKEMQHGESRLRRA